MPLSQFVRLVSLLALLVCLLGSRPASLAAPLTPLEAAEAIPETNPYREILLRLEKLPADERKALGAWLSPAPGQTAPTPTDEQRQFAVDIAAALRAAATAPRTTASDWPILPNPDDPDNPAAVTLPNVASLRELARLAAKSAETLPAADAGETYAAIAQLGRQQRSGATLIEQLVGVAIEGVAHTEVSKRLADFTAEDLRRISAAWDGLSPRPTNAEALGGERDLFFRPLLERIIVPGLREILADPEAGSVEAGAAPGEGFTRHLRLSALMDLGGGEHRIVLENTQTHESFALRPGVVVEGIELVSLDFDRRVAVIRHEKREAVIHLAARQIIERKDPARQLREMLDGLDNFNEAGSGKRTLEKLLSLVRRHPGGVDGYAKDLLVAYQAGIDRQLALAESAQISPKNPEPAASDDPLYALIMPTLGRVSRTLNNSATSATMLQAAIQHRLRALNKNADPLPFPDPWSKDKQDAFAFESTPDGGFVLRSRYELNPGQPLTYKFAAPDAGIVRSAAK